MKTIIHRSDSRGHANHGWLDTYHSFSFAQYHDPERMNFGVLRVLNDDIIVPAKGFDMHAHDNMEVITIPLSGDLAHKDSNGNSAVIRQGDVQVMSAGSGIYHSEYNAKKDLDTNILQIWVYPNKKDVDPRYDQITVDMKKTENNFLQILSPSPEDDGVWIYQNAWFYLAKIDASGELKYKFNDKANGAYVFVIDGKAEIGGESLSRRDAIGLWETADFYIKANEDAFVLVMEIPMENNIK